jgi:hypothetical protein
MTCNNSTFSSSTTFINGDNGGTRLLVQISDASCTGGVTAGDVIHYDAINLVYKKSQADNPPNSEVFGIVESVNIDGSKNIVIYGSINLPTSAIEDIPVGSTGAGGGSDIYFLSPDTAGKVRNTIPNELTQIVKPIYQVAPHGDGTYTGIVMNYIGYKVPSDITVFSSPDTSTPVGTIEYFMKGIRPPTVSENYITTDYSTLTLPNTSNQYSQYKQKYGTLFGKTFSWKFTPVATIFDGISYPTWNPSDWSDPTFLFGIYKNNSNSYIQERSIDMTNRIINFEELIYDYNATSPSNGLASQINVGDVYFLLKVQNGGWPIVGGIQFTELVNTENITIPGINSTLKLFQKTDQDGNTISQNLDDSWLYSIIKLKNNASVNTIRSLQTETVNTSNFTIDNQDLLTLINNLESRIATAEQEINK